jgi:1,4-dihydroxy-2-naphthoyl-CoA hydrolase
VIWKQKPPISVVQKMCEGTMCEHLGMIFTEIGDDFLTATMPVDRRTIQPAGLLHGGASVALAESLGSIASALCLDGKESMPVGIEINANHLKSATSGHVTGTCRAIRRGKTLHVWNIEIHNEKKELVCVSRLTVMIVPRKEK